MPSPDSHLSSAARQAIDTVCARLLENLHFRLDYERASISTFEECRETLQDWMHDACILIGLDLDEFLRLVEHYADELDLRLPDTTIAGLRGAIEDLATSAAWYGGEQAALAAFREIRELLEDLDLELDDLLPENPYAAFRHYDERDHEDWHIYEYRNLEGEGIHVDLFEYRVGSISFFVRHALETGTLTPAEEEWAAT